MAFSVIKARKAKFGYKFNIGSPDDIVEAGIAIDWAKQQRSRSDAKTFMMEWDSNMGKSELKIYTDDPHLAAMFQREFC